RRLFGNHLEQMLKKDESAWNVVVGADRRGRWLFRKPAGAPTTMAATTTPTTSATTARSSVASFGSSSASPTLVLDPTLPDPEPKLPVWLLDIPQGVTGWTRGDWAVEKSGDAWALYEHGWKPVDKKTDEVITEVPKKLSPPTPTPPVAP